MTIYRKQFKIQESRIAKAVSIKEIPSAVTTITTTKNDLADLVEKAQQGDEKAFNELVKQHYNFCLSQIKRRVKDAEQAKDLVQEVLIQVFLCLDKLSEPAAFKAWLRGIVRNVCNNYFRRNKMLYVALEEFAYELPDLTTTVDTELDLAALRQQIKTAIEQLKERQQVVVKEFYLKEKTVKEIAEELEVSENVVKVRLYRARKTLKTILAPARRSSANTSGIIPMPSPDKLQLPTASITTITTPNALEIEMMHLFVGYDKYKYKAA